MYPQAARSVPPPSFLGVLLGILRVTAVLMVVTLGAVLVLLAALIPIRIRDIRLAQWIPTGLCRAFLVITGLRLETAHAELMRRHRGFLFFNHVSFLDVIVLLAVTPLRFLATAGVTKIPLIGWMARAVGTLTVHRGDEASRSAAREALAETIQKHPRPAVAVAPEGGVGPGPEVLPLRRGAFEVAADTGQPVLLVALRFDPPGRAAWLDGEWLLGALWRLCARTAPVAAYVEALPPTLSPTADPAETTSLATERFNHHLLPRLNASRGLPTSSLTASETP